VQTTVASAEPTLASVLRYSAAMNANKLSESELSGVLAKLPNWRLEGGKLCREYQFMNFVAAFSFMTSVALVAQELDHHPDWSNSWNMVRIQLTTHDQGGISSLDAKLAYAMEEMAKRQLNP
jgi:4a-hydroxytetrahydrobiopterin dehydratase